MQLDIAGMQLHYDVHGDGEPLVWLHGGLGHGADWRYIFPEAPAGYALVAPDLRGHGRSTGAGATYSFRQSARDVLALLDALSLERVKVIGLSGGGISALHLATLAAARVSAMVVVSAPPRFPDQAKAIQRAFALEDLPAGERARLQERHQRAGQLEALIAQIHAMPDEDDPHFTPEELAGISAETLIVFGDRDPLYPVPLAVELKTAIPKSWLWVVPNGGHGPVFGDFAPRFAETALSFLAGRMASPRDPPAARQ